MRTETTTEANICEECGLSRKEWTGNNGRGVRAHGVSACCEGCAAGAGCTCKETGVRRVVVVNSEQNKQAYVKKMDRQIKDWQGKIKDLESQAKNRQADKNVTIKKKMDELQERVSQSKQKLGDVKAGKEDWAQKARGASADYRRMKASAADLGSKIKKK